MTEQKQTPPDDHELEQFLARRSELSQRYHSAVGSDVGADAAGEGAPPELDAAVLARARAELQRPAASSRRFLRWGRPLAVAASLMLVVSLGWMAQQRPLPQQVAPAAPAVVPKEVAMSAMGAIPAPPVDRKAEEAEQRKAPAKAAPPAQSLQPSPAPAADALVQRQAVEAQADIAPPPPSPEPPPPKPTSVPAQQAAPMVAAKPAVPERSLDQAYAFKRESRSALAASSAGAVAESAPVPAAPIAANASPAPTPFAAAPPPPEMTAPGSAAPVANSATAPNPCASSPVHGAALGQVQVARGPDAATWLQQIR
ncbi:MAG: hypothetical protein JWR07_5210, partial [Nevskia sp.]|nr:hypothetical protein [Nevskia sp.]